MNTPYSPFVILTQVWRTRYQCFEVGQQHQMRILGVTKVNHLVLAADVLYMYLNTLGSWSLWYISKRFRCYTFDDACFQMYSKQYHQTRKNKLHWKYIWDIMSSMYHTSGNPSSSLSNGRQTTCLIPNRHDSPSIQHIPHRTLGYQLVDRALLSFLV